MRIESIHFDADRKLLDFIERKMAKLDQIYERIIEAHIILKLENSGRIKNKIAEVKLAVPGDVLMAKATNRTFEAAMDEVLNVLKRQLIRHKERARSY